VAQVVGGRMLGAPTSAASGSRTRRRQLRRCGSATARRWRSGRPARRSPSARLPGRDAARSAASGASRCMERVRPVLVHFKPRRLGRPINSVRSRTWCQAAPMPLPLAGLKASVGENYRTVESRNPPSTSSCAPMSSTSAGPVARPRADARRGVVGAAPGLLGVGDREEQQLACGVFAGEAAGS
jgi:hypothetical protein